MDLMRVFLLLGVAAGVGWAQDAVVVPGEYGSGDVGVKPREAISGEYGTWVVTYTAGAEGIATGGGIRVQLPDTWHSGPRNSALRLQASDPRDENYISASCSRDDVVVEVIVEGERENRLIKHAKESLDGRSERYVFVVRVVVRSGALEDGDTVSVVYGDTSGGSRGYRGPAVASYAEPVLVAIDDRGDGRFQLHRKAPMMVSRPGAPIELQLHGPSQAVIGEPVDVLVSWVDKEYNASVLAGDVVLRVAEGAADVPLSVEMLGGEMFASFRVTPRTEGILRIAARERGTGLEAMSNPIRVSREARGGNVYWGDLHSHTGSSWDGVGSGSFDYARYVAGLDFYAKTDHSRALDGSGRTRGLSASTWDGYTAETDGFHDPPAFVAIHGYECSFGGPYGHHNVYFRGAPGVLLNPATTTLPELWEALTEGDAITIPHHTGKFPKGVDFSIHDERFRRNFEMYSGHGLSEVFDPLHPLAFEHSLFTGNSRSLDAPTHLQDVWAMGLRVSAVAASDDHRARPGLPQYGLAAVVAPANSRDDIFQGLYDGRTYGTTGAKILLDFSVNGVALGEVARVDGAPFLNVDVVGTDRIVWVEVLRHRPEEEGFEVVRRWEPGAWEFHGSFRDSGWVAGTMYYARVRQEKLVRRRVAMAWSSAVWTVGID